VTGDTYRMQTILLLVQNRGMTGLGSHNPDPDVNESVFFDDVRTTEIESSQEIGLRALDQALAFLTGAPTAPGEGGYGSSDPEAWLWGLRHQVRFESLLADFLGDDPQLAILADMFSISTAVHPLAPSLTAGDPRADLRWFPRPGDQFDVDAANPGLDGTTFSHGSGPVFRMVISLGASGVRGQNVIPGGQNGNPTHPNFADQAPLWLANETMPMRYLPEEVAAGAVSRERFVP
jgi:acyl-homoserine lactone acylase PvdQ